MKATFASLAILFVVILLVFLFVATNKKAKDANADSFVGTSQGFPVSQSVASKATARPDAAASGIGAFGPSDPLGNEMYNPVEAGPAAPTPSCFPRDRLSADELLPKDAANSKWAQMNPAGQGDVRDQNFLTAGYHVGVNTVGQSLRNANYQLRSEPPNPQLPVSPWNISTIEYDANRRPLEIAGDY
jgi:hypothetical protein